MYRSFFYPTRLALLAVGRNFMPMAWWMPASKEPFRFLLAVDRKNHTLSLLRELSEAALAFYPWEERAWVVRAGYLSGGRVDKARRLGVPLRPACCLAHTQVPEGPSRSTRCACPSGPGTGTTPSLWGRWSTWRAPRRPRSAPSSSWASATSPP